jgi:DNA invertase Pin-like site-specific DNA recombinase
MSQNFCMKIGYARVSTTDQNLQSQIDALTAAGCDDVVPDEVSGATTNRPKLDKLLARLGPGDVLVVVRLDRLGRSLPHLIDVVRTIEAQGAGLLSLSEAIDTTTAGGRLIFHLMGALAQFERTLIIERTQAGLQAARKRGAKVGRPRALTTDQVKHANALIASGEPPTSVARSLKVDRATLYRAMASTKGRT